MRKVLGALVIAAAAVWIYLPCLRGTWLWDDGLEVSQNAVLRTAGGWWTPWVHPGGMDYFPLKSSLQWVEWHLWGANPLGYHLVNLALHVLSALLVWRLLHRLGVRWAFVGGLLFAVHPVAVESVAWISEFKNTVSLPPLLLAAIAFVEYDNSRRPRCLLWSMGFFLAALACKTSVVMFPAVLLVYCWWRRGGLGRRDVLVSIPFFGESLAMGAATVWFQSTRSIGIAGVPESLASRAAQAGWSIVSYTMMCLWPAGLSPVYPAASGTLPAILAWLGILVVLGVFWASRRGWGRHALLAAGWFLLNLVPVLGIIPMAYYRVSPRADHFAYVSLVAIVGLVAAACGSVSAFVGRRTDGGRSLRIPMMLGAGFAACALAVTARGYAAAFHDEMALWTYAAKRNPKAWLARSNLGKALYEERRFDDAAREFREALALKPDSPEAHANLGNCLQAEGLVDDARREYAAAVAVNPGFAGAHYDLGLSYLQAGLLQRASEEFRVTLGIDPGHAAARNNLGLALAGMGRLPEAMEQYRLALGLNPELPEAHLNMGNALFRTGRLDEAVGQYREALRLYPGYSGAHNNLGQALAALGRPKEADAEFAEARRTANH